MRSKNLFFTATCIAAFVCSGKLVAQSKPNNTLQLPTQQTSSATISQKTSISTGVQQIEPVTPNFGIFPNPNNGDFIISLGQITGSTYLEIYNNIGQLIEREQLISVNTRVTMLTEADGIYHVRIIQDGKLVYKTKMAKAE